MAALNFPSNRSELNPPLPAGPLQDGDSFTDANITWTWNATLEVWSTAENNGFTQAVADSRYLRIDAGAPNQERVAGRATFDDLTVHEDGVRVTGGDVEVANLIRNTAPAAAINSVSAINSACNFGGQDVTTGITYAATRPTNVTGARQQVVGFQADSALGTDYASGTRNARGFSSNLPAAANGLSFNFYANGSAPNYFAGTLRTGQTTAPSTGPDNPDQPWFWTAQSADSNGIRVSSLNIGAALFTSTATSGMLALNRLGANSGAYISFFENGVIVDRIRLDGSGGITYGTSDYRAKENIVDLTSAVDTVKALHPVNFNFTWAPGKTRPGFIAHEVAEIIPSAVVGEKDEVESIGTYTDADGVVETEVPEPDAIPLGATWEQTGTRPCYQALDSNKIIPVLTKALQEALERIEALEALKGA